MAHMVDKSMQMHEVTLQAFNKAGTNEVIVYFQIPKYTRGRKFIYVASLNTLSGFITFNPHKNVILNIKDLAHITVLFSESLDRKAIEGTTNATIDF